MIVLDAPRDLLRAAYARAEQHKKQRVHEPMVSLDYEAGVAMGIEDGSHAWVDVGKNVPV